MRMGTVIGRVTLSVRAQALHRRAAAAHAAVEDGHLRRRGEARSRPSSFTTNSARASASSIAISEGREAACPFPKPTPVDAYCAALVDEIFYKE